MLYEVYGAHGRRVDVTQVKGLLMRPHGLVIVKFFTYTFLVFLTPIIESAWENTILM